MSNAVVRCRCSPRVRTDDVHGIQWYTTDYNSADYYYYILLSVNCVLSIANDARKKQMTNEIETKGNLFNNFNIIQSINSNNVVFVEFFAIF